jgi:maleamate amidohydrolase
MTASDERFFRERGFGRRIGFGERPAVVVVDLMKGFTDPALPLGSNLDDVVEASGRVVAAARRAAAPVLYTVLWYEPGLGDAGVWALKQDALRTLTYGSEATELDPRLGRLAEEPTLLKKYASAFFGTDLVSRLNAGAIDTLLITGATTSGCVRATAVDAVQYGYRPIVVREAVGDRSRAAHEQSLFDLDQKYADVVDLDEALGYLESLSSAAVAGEAELEARWAAAEAAPRGRGSVRLICVRRGGEVHECPPRVLVTPERGVDGDRWVESDRREPDAQVTLMNVRVTELIRGDQPLDLPGDNFQVDLDLSEEALPAGTRLRLGEAVLEVSALPHTGCKKFRERFGLEALTWVNGHRDRRLRGMNCRVLERGWVAVGDPVEVVQRGLS